MIVGGTSGQKRIFFEGNSLTNLAALTTTPTLAEYNANYVAVSVYNTLKGSYNLCYQSYAISGQTGTQILSASASIPFLKKGDVVIYWEGTNDIYVNGLTGQQAFDNVSPFVALVLAKGAKIIVCTALARDFSLDNGTVLSRIGDYNTLIRANTSLGYTLCDLGANTLFDDRADCSNSTYYVPDKLHLKTAGSDIQVTSIVSSITSIL
jgi:hypothetical protein